MCGSFPWSRPCTLPYRGGSHMRKWIGSALLVAAVVFIPAQLVAQRRPAARPAPRSADRPSFGLQLDWGNDPNFGIGGRGVVPPRPPPPRAPRRAILGVAHFFLRDRREYLER